VNTATVEPALVFVACAVLLVAHTTRALRWAILFPSSYLANRFHLLMGLAIGYAVNAVLPWHSGELLRAGYVSVREGVRLPFVLATVAAERLADLATFSILATIFATLRRGSEPNLWHVAQFFWMTTVIGVILALQMRHSPVARRLIWRIASIFNDRVRTAMLDFSWSYSELILRGGLWRTPFVSLTLVMWTLYGVAYAILAHALHVSWASIVDLLHGHPLLSFSAAAQRRGAATAIPFVMSPVAVVLIYGLARQWLTIVKAVTRFGYGIPTSVTSSRERFKVSEEYSLFLAALFSGNDGSAYRFGLTAIDEGVVHRFFAGGSEAVTALIEIDENLYIRKFGIEEAAKKLRSQADWIESHSGLGLPLVSIAGRHEGGVGFRYDMPFIVPANDYYDVIHTAPRAVSLALLSDVVDRVRLLHASGAPEMAPMVTVEAYLQTKAIANADNILRFARSLLPTAIYDINGTSFELDEWTVLRDLPWLSEQILDRRIARIHGDLTIENIIVAPNYTHGWYAIDPNQGNIFDSPLIDLAKLMQSLHLGYEGLNRHGLVGLSGGAIAVPLTRSQAYAEMHSFLEQELLTLYGESGLREIYFHELVNYLRLIPYKIRRHPSKGLCFFACASILLRKYRERWPCAA
jgi:hypothetical protein